ncbi:hypothetical protein [Aneurinibacillus tyrosinisolvens]|uniref:hypothetical protein n=1 Tax=Aneurinibacillus tyrosinisolvens TaxID=1443435 RepID=UPI00063F9B63|nr:hypothetical protein [Aneurinibacillus tyrosinisolvens]
MKIVKVIALSLIMLFGLVGCSEKGDSQQTGSQSTELPFIWKGQSDDWKATLRTEADSLTERKQEKLTVEYIGKNPEKVGDISYALKNGKEAIRSGTETLNQRNEFTRDSSCSGCQTLSLPKEDWRVEITANKKTETITLIQTK